LAHALEKDNELWLAIGNRKSGQSISKRALMEQTNEMVKAMHVPSDRIIGIHCGCEKGWEVKDRPALWAACNCAYRFQTEHPDLRVGVLFRDITRILRSDDYNRSTNRDVEPTADKWRRLSPIFQGQRLYTFVPPWASDREIQSRAIKLGKGGRPARVSPAAVSEALGFLTIAVERKGNNRYLWRNSPAAVAAKLGISERRIRQLYDARLPNGRTVVGEGLEKSRKMGLPTIVDYCPPKSKVKSQDWWPGKRGRPPKSPLDISSFMPFPGR
jgi:hypothetical protein